MAKQSGDKRSQGQQQQGGKGSKTGQQQQSPSPDAEEFPSNQGDTTEQDYADEVNQTHQHQRQQRD